MYSTTTAKTTYTTTTTTNNNNNNNDNNIIIIYATADEAVAYMFYRCFFLFFMSPLRRHIFVCFMAKSAFWRGFSALAPYTGVGPI